MTLLNRTDGPIFDPEGAAELPDGSPAVRPSTDSRSDDPTMTPRKRADDETTRPLTLPDPDVNASRLGDKRLLEMAIAATPDPLKPGSAIPATRFATDHAFCNDRTIRRYLAGERDLPALLREKCIHIVTEAAKLAAAAKSSRRAKK